MEVVVVVAVPVQVLEVMVALREIIRAVLVARILVAVVEVRAHTPLVAGVHRLSVRLHLA
jgi:hypothetical protein